MGGPAVADPGFFVVMRERFSAWPALIFALPFAVPLTAQRWMRWYPEGKGCGFRRRSMVPVMGRWWIVLSGEGGGFGVWVSEVGQERGRVE